jgi:hypothetical protein
MISDRFNDVGFPMSVPRKPGGRPRVAETFLRSVC